MHRRLNLVLGVFFVTLAIVFTSFVVVSATEAELDLMESTNVRSTGYSNQLLRLAEHGISKNSILNDDKLVKQNARDDKEDRGIVGWSVTKVFNGLEKLLGRKRTAKLRVKFVVALFKRMNAVGVTPDIVRAAARKEGTTPGEKAFYNMLANIYADGFKKSA